jgi:hypothetical protein
MSLEWLDELRAAIQTAHVLVHLDRLDSDRDPGAARAAAVVDAITALRLALAAVTAATVGEPSASGALGSAARAGE